MLRQSMAKASSFANLSSSLGRVSSTSTTWQQGAWQHFNATARTNTTGQLRSQRKLSTAYARYDKVQQQNRGQTPSSSQESNRPSESNKQHNDSGSTNVNSDMQTNFASLGLGRNMKIFLVVCISILGTMETWFWCKAIWVWWKGGHVGGNTDDHEGARR